MIADANSVNIKSYHHGGLREAALAEGLKLLRVGGAEGVSLREIARNAGVSATALYRHFPDKTALLKALAGAGFAQLGTEQAMASEQGGFTAVGQAYVRFALANPALFRLMFATLPAEAHPEIEGPEGSAAALLHDGIVHLMPGASKEARFAAMLRAWSLVHGLSMLILDGQVDRTTAEAMIGQIIGEDSLNLA